MRQANSRSIATTLLTVTALSASALSAESSRSNETIYRVRAEESHFEVDVGRAGLFKVFGHDHVIEVTRFEGEVAWSADAPESSRFRLDVDAASLTVQDEEVSDEDRAKIQGDMESEALALPGNPRIRFESTGVEVARGEGPAVHLKVTGTLSLRGMSNPLVIPLTITATEGRLTAKGEVDLESGKWGVPEISALGGSVKTKGTLQLAFEVVAVRE
jgi:polyisoprenoid-binding protein YceI